MTKSTIQTVPKGYTPNQYAAQRARERNRMRRAIQSRITAASALMTVEPLAELLPALVKACDAVEGAFLLQAWQEEHEDSVYADEKTDADRAYGAALETKREVLDKVEARIVENRDEIEAALRDAYAADVAEYVAHVQAGEAIRERAAKSRAILAALQDKNPGSRAAPLSAARVARYLPGGGLVRNLLDNVGALAAPDFEYLTTEEYQARLAAGESVENVKVKHGPFGDRHGALGAYIAP
jgi:hypothetical protein